MQTLYTTTVTAAGDDRHGHARPSLEATSCYRCDYM